MRTLLAAAWRAAARGSEILRLIEFLLTCGEGEFTLALGAVHFCIHTLDDLIFVHIILL